MPIATSRVSRGPSVRRASTCDLRYVGRRASASSNTQTDCCLIVYMEPKHSLSGVVCSPLTLTERDSIGILSHKPLLTQQQRFDRLTVSVSFHSPACMVVRCTVGVIVTRGETAALPKERKFMKSCDLFISNQYCSKWWLQLMAVKRKTQAFLSEP